MTNNKSTKTKTEKQSYSEHSSFNALRRPKQPSERSLSYFSLNLWCDHVHYNLKGEKKSLVKKAKTTTNIFFQNVIEVSCLMNPNMENNRDAESSRVTKMSL